MGSPSDSIPTGGEIALNRPSHATTNPPPLPSRPRNNGVMMHIVYACALTVIVPILIALLALKYQNKKQSPFETHGFFMIVAIVRICVTVLAFLAIVYTKSYSRTSIREHLSPIHFMILKIVFCASGILGPVSLMIVLCIPPNLNGIGYSIVIFIVAIAVGYNATLG